MSSSATPAPVCPCGSTSVEPGFVDDVKSHYARVRWVVGKLKVGVFGGTRRAARSTYYLQGRRCTDCGRVELFAVLPT